MGQFKWQDRYDIGVDAMNDDHKVLLRLMDELEDLARRGNDAAATKAAMTKLGEFTNKHFSDEEAFMASFSYPGIDSHKLIHKNLLEKFGAYQRRLMSGEKLDEGFFDFLNIWLASHICGIDVKYGQHLRTHKKAV